MVELKYDKPPHKYSKFSIKNDKFTVYLVESKNVNYFQSQLKYYLLNNKSFDKYLNEMYFSLKETNTNLFVVYYNSGEVLFINESFGGLLLCKSNLAHYIECINDFISDAYKIILENNFNLVINEETNRQNLTLTTRVKDYIGLNKRVHLSVEFLRRLKNKIII